MRITSKQLRQIIREELVREAYGDQSYNSYFALKRVVDWALRTQMDMAGNANIGARERMMGEMFQIRGESTVLIPPPELFAPIRDKLLATPKVSAVVMDTDMGAEMSGAFRLTVVGCPGWPTSMTHDDFYKVAQFVNRSPAYSELIAAYEAVFGDGEGPDDVPDEELALTRGFVFMMVDLILASAPKGHTAFYVNEVDMEIGVWKSSHPVPKGLTMATLLGAGGMRAPAVDRRPERLDVLDMPRSPVGDDFNEGRLRTRRNRFRQIIKEELVREFYDDRGDDRWEDEPSGPSGDQYELMTSLNMKDVALSMINSWGSEDILVMVDILTSDDPAARGQFPPGEEDDLDRAQDLFDDLLSPFGLTIDPEDRRLTPREKGWFGKLLRTITRLASDMNAN